MPKSATPWQRGRTVWIPDGTELVDDAGERCFLFDAGGQRLVEIRSDLDDPIALIYADEGDDEVEDNFRAMLAAGADDGALTRLEAATERLLEAVGVDDLKREAVNARRILRDLRNPEAQVFTVDVDACIANLDRLLD